MPVRDFLLPDLGEGLEDAEIVAWRVAEGDAVELNQVLVEVNTAKAMVEIPAPWEGVVEKLHGAAGDVVEVGKPLVSIRVGDAEVPATGGGDATAPDPAAVAAQAQQTAQEVGPEAGAGADGVDPDGPKDDDGRPRRRAVLVGYGVTDDDDDAPRGRGARSREGTEGPVAATPPVRRMAKGLGIDLAAVEGSGPGGRVTREDLVRVSGQAEPGADARGNVDEVEVIQVRGTRRLIAAKMARSAREIPHVTTFLTVDATWLQAFRSELATPTGTKVSPLPIVVRALADVCAVHPDLNASYDAEGDAIRRYRMVHMGIATDTERGLLVPVVRDAGSKGIARLAEEIARLSEGARAGTLGPEELTGGTITVTNVGTFGAEYGTPIINHPEAAILALGVVEPRALVVDGRVEARPAVTLSLSFDHRVLDGAQAGRALRALGDILESPFRLGGLPR